MKLRIILLFLLFLGSNPCSGAISDDLATVLSYYKYDPLCAFNYTQVNSKTIKKFPSCDKIFGILVFNEKTDLTVTQLASKMINVTQLYGGLVVENTKFESLSFLTRPAGNYLRFYCEKYGVFIRNNPNLTDYSMLAGVFVASDSKGKEGTIEVVNNTKLDAQGLCQSGFFHYFTDLRVKENLKDCGCNGDEINDSNLPNFSSCERSWNGLYLRNISTSDLSNLSNITHIRGIIDISGTNLEDLTFLKNLQSFRYRNQILRAKVAFNLQSNPKMKRLGLPSSFNEIHNTEVESADGPEEGIALFNFENLHPEFCLTTAEINFFLDKKVAFLNLDAKLCNQTEDLVMTDNGTKTACRFESMSLLGDDCYVILGDVVVDSGDEEHMVKLIETIYIYGSLTVKNTDLKSLDYFYNLKYMIYLGEGPVIQIISNKNLKSPYFEGLQSVVVRDKRTAVIQDNHPEIFSKYGGNCTLVESLDMYRVYRTRMSFSGQDCGYSVEIVPFDKTTSASATAKPADTKPSADVPVKDNKDGKDNDTMRKSLGFTWILCFYFWIQRNGH